MKRDEKEPIQPWERLPAVNGRRRESAVAHEACRVYCQLPPDQRSLRRTAKIIGKSLTLIEHWSAQHHWVDRAAARDRHLARIKDEQHEKSIREEEEKWAKRDQEQREHDYQDGLALRRKGRMIADYPLVETEVDSNGQKVHMHPARWSAAQGPSYIEKGSELCRRAIERHGPVHRQDQDTLCFKSVVAQPEDKDKK